MNLLTTKEAAEKLGVSYVRINQLIVAGRLPAQKMGRDYVIDESDLKLVADRKPGRPRKPEKEKSEIATERKKSAAKKVVRK